MADNLRNMQVHFQGMYAGIYGSVTVLKQGIEEKLKPALTAVSLFTLLW